MTEPAGRPTIDEALIARVVQEVFPEAWGVWLYGSFAHGRARRDSDLDIAILPDRPIDPTDRWRRSELVSSRLPKTVDLVDLRQVGTVLRFEVVTGGRRIAARDPDRCDIFETAVVAMFQRLNEGQREHIDEIYARGSIVA